jgi:hypothetical protein
VYARGFGTKQVYRMKIYKSFLICPNLKVEDMIDFSDAGQQPPSAGKQCMTRMKIEVAYAFVILFEGGLTVIEVE